MKESLFLQLLQLWLYFPVMILPSPALFVILIHQLPIHNCNYSYNKYLSTSYEIDMELEYSREQNRCCPCPHRSYSLKGMRHERRN